jgi:hypothetical protein
MFEFRHAGHIQMAQIIRRPIHALVVAVTGNTTFIVCRNSPLCAGAPSRRSICLRDSCACINCPIGTVFRKLLYGWADKVESIVANGNDCDITNSNFETEFDLITRLADKEKINIAQDGPLWTLVHAFTRYQTFVWPQTWARVARRQCFDVLPIRKIVFVEDNHVEADL